MASKKKDRKKPLLIAAAVLAVLAVAAGVAGAPYLFAGAPADGLVKVRHGSTLDTVTDSIARNIDIDFANRVGRLLRMTRSDLSRREGAFAVNKGDSPFKVFRMLRSGAQSPIKFSFNNIRTREQFARCWGETFMEGEQAMTRVLNDSAFLASIGRTPENITGILSPDSYEFYWNTSAEKFVKKMKAFYDNFWTEERLAKAKSQGLTPEQVEIIASIVEEETAKADERPKVARLYMNRLADRMPLQADPTVKFAIGDFGIRRLTVAMTRTPSPYNTYVNPGLPPGPIRLPMKRTLDDVINAPVHNYIYMCAKEDFSGYHNFAVSYSEHLGNAHRYQAELNRRNIK